MLYICLVEPLQITVDTPNRIKGTSQILYFNRFYIYCIFIGTAGNSMSYHNGNGFSTIDKDQNKCAEKCRGGWWYNNCIGANLNGEYGNVIFAKGVTYYTLTGHRASLKQVEIKIRERT